MPETKKPGGKGGSNSNRRKSPPSTGAGSGGRSVPLTMPATFVSHRPKRKK